ncbi:hypothetical protein PIB30_070044 [Stylosanthes scabra]|uniref:H15 domain-containing protein n=1 Tax=Stylosanthes scabra TaxID=79078 RepID=A0ABU6TN19_9FABA|nr:hypothetical protein [Stylosanthes scabra]
MPINHHNLRHTATHKPPSTILSCLCPPSLCDPSPPPLPPLATFLFRRIRLRVLAVTNSCPAFAPQQPSAVPPTSLRHASSSLTQILLIRDNLRNFSVSNGTQGSKEKSRVPRIKAAPAGIATPVAACNVVVAAGEDATPATNVTHQPDPSSVAVGDSSQYEEYAKNPPRYNAMVLEAMSALKDAYGSDLNAIVSFIEALHINAENGDVIDIFMHSSLRKVASEFLVYYSQEIVHPSTFTYI